MTFQFFCTCPDQNTTTISLTGETIENVAPVQEVQIFTTPANLNPDFVPTVDPNMIPEAGEVSIGDDGVMVGVIIQGGPAQECSDSNCKSLDTPIENLPEGTKDYYYYQGFAHFIDKENKTSKTTFTIECCNDRWCYQNNKVVNAHAPCLTDYTFVGRTVIKAKHTVMDQSERCEDPGKLKCMEFKDYFNGKQLLHTQCKRCCWDRNFCNAHAIIAPKQYTHYLEDVSGTNKMGGFSVLTSFLTTIFLILGIIY